MAATKKAQTSSRPIPGAETTKVLVTGSRDWTDQRAVARVLEAVWTLLAPVDGGFTLVHGAARGLDTLAAQEASRYSTLSIEAHPADWSQHSDQCPAWDAANATCKLAGFRRNDQMIATKPAVALAFPLHPLEAQGKGTSRGTWHCAKAARDAGVPVLVHWHDALFPFDDAARALLDSCAPTVARGEHGQLSLDRLVLPF